VGDDIDLASYRDTARPRGSRALNAHLATLFEHGRLGRESRSS
jgi:hypothetical protein